MLLKMLTAREASGTKSACLGVGFGVECAAMPEEIPPYALNDTQELIRLLQEAYRRRQDILIRADDCQQLADSLREQLRSRSYEDSGSLLF